MIDSRGIFDFENKLCWFHLAQISFNGSASTYVAEHLQRCSEKIEKGRGIPNILSAFPHIFVI